MSGLYLRGKGGGKTEKHEENDGEEKLEKEDYYRYERSCGSFIRRFDLPEDIDSGKIKAHFEDGVLEVRMPRTKTAEKKPKKISIE